MKLLALLLLAGCTVTPRYFTEIPPKPKTHNETLKSCVKELIGTFGVKPTEALTICSRIYRRE